MGTQNPLINTDTLGSAEGVVAGHHHGGEDQDGRDGDENGEGGPRYAVPAVEPDVLGQNLELVRGAVLEPAKLEELAHAAGESPASRPPGTPVSLFSATPGRSACTGGRDGVSRLPARIARKC